MYVGMLAVGKMNHGHRRERWFEYGLFFVLFFHSYRLISCATMLVVFVN